MIESKEAPRNKVLYVDDDPDIQQIVKISLEELGRFNVTLCSSGTQALEILKQRSFQLIMIDVMMPQMSGPETLERILRDVSPTPPIVFITAQVPIGGFEPQKLKGCSGVISKPFDPYELPKKVQQFLSQPTTSDGGALDPRPRTHSA